MFFHLDADRGTSPLNLVFVAVQSQELVRTPHRELHVKRRRFPPLHPACLTPGPLKGPLVLHTEPRARLRATPPPHVLSILPHGRAEPGQALQPTPLSHQPPPSSGLSPSLTLACPELPTQGWASPASSLCSGALGLSTLTPCPRGQLQRAGQGRRQRRPGSSTLPSPSRHRSWAHCSSGTEAAG